MSRFRYQPALVSLPSNAAAEAVDPLGGFLQEIRMIEKRVLIATARWHVPAGEQGAMQIVDLNVAPDQRRKGMGSILLREIFAQASVFSTTRQVRLRRAWASVEQKTQIEARAFFTQHGFHHVATIPNLLVRQDALIYMKAFD